MFALSEVNQETNLGCKRLIVSMKLELIVFVAASDLVAKYLIRTSAQEFIDKEKSNPESMEALFEAMDFETPYTFVIKKIHNKEYDKYEMKIVYFE